MAYQIEGFDFDKHLDFIIDTAKTIKPNEVTVLTGPNGYGKSLLRKIVGPAMEKEGVFNGKVCSFSMNDRTVAKDHFAALRSLSMDQADEATSDCTCTQIHYLLGKDSDNKYIVIDEPEIGMGKEVLLGLIDDIVKTIDEKKAAGTFKGLMIITHSEFFIDNFQHDRFVNLEGLTYEQWKNREIKAISTKDLDEWCLQLWRTVQKRSNK